MTAKTAKARMLWWLLYRFGYHAAVTEKSGLFGIADVYAITKARYVHEIEIKVERGDLMSELSTIKKILNGEQTWRGKGHKHSYYLQKSGSDLALGRQAIEHIPNRFSFAVPYDLVDIALPYLENTPYGLYKIHPERNYVEKVKKAEWLHKEKLNDKGFMYLMRKVSVEIQTLREKEAVTV